MKACKVCNVEKDLDEFYFRKDSSTYRKECKECTIHRHREKNSGCGKETYEKTLESQDGKCAICNIDINEYVNQKSKRYKGFAADHCHDTGKFRGLLCTSCNTGIGLFKDNPDILMKAIKYLERSKI